MKTFIIFVAVLVILVPGKAQEDPQWCGNEFDPEKPIDMTQLGGIYLTSLGQLNVLVVFVSFPNDNNSHPWWPVGQPPDSLEYWIDLDVSANRQNYANLTNYFRQMSMGLFQVVGEAIWWSLPSFMDMKISHSMLFFKSHW